MKSNKNLKEFFIAIGQIFLWIIGTIIVMGSARMFAKWFVPQAVAQFPFLVYLTPFFVLATFAFALSKRLRDKTKNLFLNLFKKSYKKNTLKQLLLPKNKFARFVVNVGFIPVWFQIVRFIGYTGLLDFLDSFYFFFLWSLLFVPIFFYTLFLWFEKRFMTIGNTFIKVILNKKEIGKRLKSILNSLSKTNISEATELNRFADLRDKGIITEEEFQSKKKKLLDL